MQKHAVGLVLASALLMGCGGAAADKVRPKDITGTTALGASVPACGAEPKLASPLVVDLDSAARADLEASMKKGVVVVAYDCKSLRVLRSCQPQVGSYEYAGVGRKEQVVKMKNQDDLSVNLPLSAGKVGASLSSGNSIDLALVLVGQRSTTVDRIDSAAMPAEGCEGATHFLQVASLGAFSMSTGSAGNVAAVADLFKVSGSASSDSSRSASTTDGSLEACRTSDPDAPAPPTECRSPISVVLQPLAGSAKPAPKKQAAADTKAADNKTADNKIGGREPKPLENPCPPDYVFANSVCTRSADAAHLCKPENDPDCKAQCDKGNAGSCYNYGAHGAAPNEREAYYKKACDGGFADGCGWYALMHWDSDNTKNPANKPFIELARKGCAMGGTGESCDMLGYFLWDQDKTAPFADLPGAIRAYDRGCSLGNAGACTYAADFYLDGEGVPKDEAKGIDRLDHACFGGNELTCALLAKHVIKTDPKRALHAMQHACRESESECGNASFIAHKIGEDAEAFALAKSGCDRDPSYCTTLGDLYHDGIGTPKDLAKAKEYWKKTCAADKALDPTGDSEACDKANGTKPKKSPNKPAGAKK